MRPETEAPLPNPHQVAITQLVKARREKLQQVSSLNRSIPEAEGKLRSDIRDRVRFSDEAEKLRESLVELGATDDDLTWSENLAYLPLWENSNG